MQLVSRGRCFAALAAATLLLPYPARAQVDPWEQVKLVPRGKGVHVKLRSGKTVKGRMDAWTVDGLSVRQGDGKAAALARPDVAQVAMMTGMSRGRRAAWAALIGGGAGAAVFGGACAAVDCFVPAAAVAGRRRALVGGIAAGVAALFPQRKEVIYEAPGKRP